MRYADDPKAYNTAVAKLVQGLKRDVGASSIAQNYKGTGAQAHRRQLFVRYPGAERGVVDVWLDSGYAEIGGVAATPRGVTQRRLVYDDQPPEVVYAWLVGQLRQTLPGASLSGIGGFVAGLFGGLGAADPVTGKKVIATSFERYRLSAARARAVGGSTATRFYVSFAEDAKTPSKWMIVEGYGPTPGDRKTQAIRKFLAARAASGEA